MKASWGLGILTIVGVGVVSSPAASACCVAYDYAHATSQTERVITQISFKLQQLETNIVEALRLSTGQITNNIKQQTAAQERLMSAQTDQRYTLERKALRAQAVMNHESAPSACAALTSSTSGVAADVVSEKISSQMQHVNTAWRTGKEVSPSAAGPAAAMAWNVSQRQEKYTCADGETQWLTPNIVPTCEADTQAGTLFDSPVLDQASLDATQAFLRNVYDPIPDGAIPSALEDQNVGVVALRLSKDARLSLAEKAGSDATGRRTPSIEHADWARSTAAQIPNFDPTTIHDVDGKISWFQWMEIKSSYRFLSPTWQTNLQSAGPTALLREMTIMMAEQRYLDWHRYQLEEQQSLVTSANLALGAEKMRGSSTAPGALVPNVETVQQ
jgi:hypothetical protein